MDVLMDDIPYNLHAMVEIIGMGNFLKLSKLYGGTNVYIPVYHRVTMGERNREIARTYNGKNINQLRMKYGMTELQLKRLAGK
ncbi:MAG: Mor transcription activator family protein [Terrisporobacter othiniensis]|nr:Mor transcription activator family protein [Terrisporobacter othiniensis]MDU6996350.1 Mor transcription activator family protein [Terrisporobacter othiniensis]